MADTKTSAELTASTLTGTELIRVVQGGADRKTTLNTIVSNLGLGGATADNSITNAKLEDMVAYTLKGNATGALADPQDIAVPVSSVVGRDSSGNITALTMGSNMSIVAGALTAAGGAPTTAEYIVASSDATLSAERVLTNSTSITKNVGTAGQVAFERAALTGDVTATANSNATTIAPGVVANAKLATMAANTVKANATTGLATPTDIALALSNLIGRGETGNIAPITLGSNLSMTDNVLSAQSSGATLVEVWAAGGVRFDGTNYIDENAAVISGNPAVADQTALLALSAATYENFSVTVTNGLNRSTWTSNGASFGPLNGQYIQERQTVPGDTYVIPDNVTWTAADNGSGKVRLTSSAAHGITEVNAEGNYLYLISGGTGWTAGTSHQIAVTTGYVSTTQLDLTTNYTASMGVPVFAKASTTDALAEIPLKTITLPALRANSEVILEYNLEWSDDASSTGQRRGKFFLDVTEIQNNNTTATRTRTTSYRHGFRNQNNTSIQRGICGSSGSGYGVGSIEAPATAAIATGTTGKVITIKGMTSVIGITVCLAGYDLIIRG